jgi:hypothetical protein
MDEIEKEFTKSCADDQTQNLNIQNSSDYKDEQNTSYSFFSPKKQDADPNRYGLIEFQQVEKRFKNYIKWLNARNQRLLDQRTKMQDLTKFSQFELYLESKFRINFFEHPLILRSWKNSILKVKTNICTRINEQHCQKNIGRVNIKLPKIGSNGTSQSQLSFVNKPFPTVSPSRNNIYQQTKSNQDSTSMNTSVDNIRKANYGLRNVSKMESKQLYLNIKVNRGQPLRGFHKKTSQSIDFKLNNTISDPKIIIKH